MAPTVEAVVKNIEFGEGPHWDDATQSLYFIDMGAKSIHRYVPSTKKHTKAVLGTDHVSVIIPVRGQKDKFLISSKRELAVVTWDGESDKVSEIRTIFKNDSSDSVGTQFNDAKCDPTGRLWIGSMFEPVPGQLSSEKRFIGSFYSFQRNKLKTFLTNIGISNGLAFNVELKKLYYIDSFKGSVDELDFDVENGSIDNRKSIFTNEKHDIPGFPDGMAIDSDGNLWVAIMSGSRVVKIDPRNPETVLETIILPTKQVTSVAFGGKNLDELYVTTGKPLDGSPASPEDGSLFRITGLNAKGLPGVSIVL